MPAMKPMKVSVGTRVRASYIDLGAVQSRWAPWVPVGVPVEIEGVVTAMRAEHLNGGTAVLLDIREDNSRVATTVDLVYVTDVLE